MDLFKETVNYEKLFSIEFVDIENILNTLLSTRAKNREKNMFMLDISPNIII